jgi:hypothetical protein
VLELAMGPVVLLILMLALEQGIKQVALLPLMVGPVVRQEMVEQLRSRVGQPRMELRLAMLRFRVEPLRIRATADQYT